MGPFENCFVSLFHRYSQGKCNGGSVYILVWFRRRFVGDTGETIKFRSLCIAPGHFAVEGCLEVQIVISSHFQPFGANPMVSAMNNMYVHSATSRVQIRRYKLVCTDSSVQTRTYRFARTYMRVQSRVYRPTRTDP